MGQTARGVDMYTFMGASRATWKDWDFCSCNCCFLLPLSFRPDEPILQVHAKKDRRQTPSGSDASLNRLGQGWPLEISGYDIGVAFGLVQLCHRHRSHNADTAALPSSPALSTCPLDRRPAPASIHSERSPPPCCHRPACRFC